MFNGDVGQEAYVGGLIGYYAAPTISIFLSSTESAIGGFAFAGGLGSAGVAISSTMAGSLVTVGAIGLTSVGALAANGVMMFAKTSRQSKKVTSIDKPSWVNESMVDPTKKAQQNAKNILDWKYGSGNWTKGPTTEYNKIVKWIERYLRYYRGW